jgi:hypothetical protein
MKSEMERYKRICADRFSTHKATIITENDRYFILDWRREDGGGDWYINFIVDKKRGAFIVSGDLGDSIAVWYNPITPEELRGYVFNVDYYVKKIECASDLYIYNEDDIIADLKEYIDIDAEDAYLKTHNEYGNSSELWGDITEYIRDSLYERDQFIPSDDLITIIKDFDPDYWEWLHNCGKRIDGRVYIWAIGFNMAMKQLGR